jgi:hypothetical protein
MLKKLALGIATLSLMATSAFAALQSGPQKGGSPTIFDVVDVSGPRKGSQLCYV